MRNANARQGEDGTLFEAASHQPPAAQMRGKAIASSQELLEHIDLHRLTLTDRLAADPKHRASLGQFFTPADVAGFMSGLFELEGLSDEIRLLDPGAGSGGLTAAVVAELCGRPQHVRPKRISATTWELDPQLIPHLQETLSVCTAAALQAGVSLDFTINEGSFIIDAAEILLGDGLFTRSLPARFDAVIMNPPYRKLRSDSDERRAMSQIGIETSNLYSAFVWLAMRLLSDDGELVAITPRSFMNGTYFRPFRKAITRFLSLTRVHVYDSRDAAFAGDDVLQENVIFHGRRGIRQGELLVSTSLGPADKGLAVRTIAPNELVHADDAASVFHIVPDENDARIAETMSGLPHSLAELEVSVSTGRVVCFRSREKLRLEGGPGDAPLVFPRHCIDGVVKWPMKTGEKPDALTPTGPEDEQLLPAGWYVVVKRFSAKEEPRRIVASVYDPTRIRAPRVAFDNKLNVLHRDNAGLPELLAKGLAAFLNSTAADAYFRQFSGHTQVNAGDLRSMRFPSAVELNRLGESLDGCVSSGPSLDNLIHEGIAAMSEIKGSVAAKKRVKEAERILKALGAPRAQCNERSALTLLSLLDLGPADGWSNARAALRGVTELMDWMSSTYGKKYAPNTRETIRRLTLHQLVEMGLVLLNPDEPGRATNSPKNAYQIEPGALELLQSYGTAEWDKALPTYLASAEESNRLHREARKMARIPVSFPDGTKLELTPGGQNVLVKEIIEQFAPRFTPGGYVVYVGDAGKKHLLYDEEYLKNLGVEIEPHGKMPDVVIHDVKRDWLVLIEAVTSHGPVNVLRHNQLRDLFCESTAGLVYVTTFLDRAAMREYLPEIAWETEVWVADAPTHLIHFNGERFLGPYGSHDAN